MGDGGKVAHIHILYGRVFKRLTSSIMSAARTGVRAEQIMLMPFTCYRQR